VKRASRPPARDHFIQYVRIRRIPGALDRAEPGWCTWLHLSPGLGPQVGSVFQKVRSLRLSRRIAGELLDLKSARDTDSETRRRAKKIKKIKVMVALSDQVDRSIRHEFPQVSRI